MIAIVIGLIIGFMLFVGFGISTDIYADFLGVSKQVNDNISFLLGIVMVAFIIYIS